MVSDSRERTLRYELKLVCQESAYERVRMALRLHPAGVRELYPSRRVQSIYLDTSYNRALEENLAGISHREKVRFRWYGDDAKSVRGTLELKVRENMLGWKRTVRFDEEVEVEGADRYAFLERLRSLAPEEWRHTVLHGLEPVQWISYLRDYYARADGTVRITLDRDLCLCDQRGRRFLSSTRPKPTPRFLILELKCDPERHEEARELVDRLPLMVDRCSKFVLASDPSHGPATTLFPD